VPAGGAADIAARPAGSGGIAARSGRFVGETCHVIVDALALEHQAVAIDADLAPMGAGDGGVARSGLVSPGDRAGTRRLVA